MSFLVPTAISTNNLTVPGFRLLFGSFEVTFVRESDGARITFEESGDRWLEEFPGDGEEEQLASLAEAVSAAIDIRDRNAQEGDTEAAAFASAFFDPSESVTLIARRACSRPAGWSGSWAGRWDGRSRRARASSTPSPRRGRPSPARA